MKQKINKKPAGNIKPGKTGEGFGITSFILGILSITAVLSYGLSIFLVPIFSILGIVFSIVQTKTGKNKFATAGIILSIIGFVIFLIFMLLIMSFKTA